MKLSTIHVLFEVVIKKIKLYSTFKAVILKDTLHIVYYIGSCF